MMLPLPVQPNLVWRDFNPYKRFLLGLSLCISLSVLMIVLVVNSLIGRFLISSTAQVTEDAIVRHVRLILPNIFDVSLAAVNDAPATHDMNAMIDPYTGQSMGAMTEDSMNLTVRLHLNLYNITDATFFAPNGKIAFAYKRERIGKNANALEKIQLSKLEQSGPSLSAANQKIQVWLPVRKSQNDPGLIGFVSLERDMRSEWAQVRQIEWGVAGVGVIAAFGLFFVLRRVFIASTQEIASKNTALTGLTEELEASYNSLLRALSSAMDSRDHETADHTNRVTRYAVRLGQEMKLSQEQLLDLERGALLHDIGKIGVPDGILLKPGRLDANEMRLMRAHVEHGDAMLREIPFLGAARFVVRHHHERFDGRGYPASLAGNEIPLLARIFSLCDTYDAITSQRPYKKARSDSEAREIIRQENAQQFDPEVVQAFEGIAALEWQSIGQISDPNLGQSEIHESLSSNQSALARASAPIASIVEAQ
jgi:HD-GYP domain-containing protein (c-di-GMP phosphodiesterase class II)